MSESFDARIREIRELMEPALALNRWEDLNPEYVLALVDIVEAAHAHVVARRDRLPSEWPRLLNALARFESL